MNLGPTELIILLVIVLVLFGGSKLPKLAKSLGEAQKEFKRSTEDEHTPTTAHETITPTPPTATSSRPAVNPTPQVSPPPSRDL